MKYIGMSFGMWALFALSFRKQLTVVFGCDEDTAKAITKKAKPRYKAIIHELPEFEKGDRFKMNLVNCAMIGATDFVRQYTLASGGPYCDRGYKKKGHTGERQPTA